MNAHTPSIPSSDEIFAAHADERLYVGSPARDPDFRRQLLAVLGALALYLMFVAVLAIEARFPPVVIPAEDEIPVEIVVAPPPPPQPTPEPKQETPPPDTTPAYDAPKSGKSEKDDSAASDKDAKAAPAAPAMDASAERASGAEEDAKASTPEAPTVPNVAPPTPETPPAPVLEGDAPPPNPQQAMSARASPSKPAPAAGKPKPLFDSVPDVDFGGAAKMAPVSGGNGPSHYLNIVYGMIMQHLHRPAGRELVPRIKGVVVFNLDSQGRLVERWVEEPSSSPDLDRAVFEAIGAASPFPPPPFRAPSIRFTYNDK